MLVINKAVWDGLTRRPADGPDHAGGNIAAHSIKIFTTPGSTVAQDLVNCGVKYLYATDADKAAADQGRPRAAIKSLAPESQDYVTQIQDLAKTLPPPPAPPPLPTAKTGECVPPAG